MSNTGLSIYQEEKKIQKLIEQISEKYTLNISENEFVKSLGLSKIQERIELDKKFAADFIASVGTEDKLKKDLEKYEALSKDLTIEVKKKTQDLKQIWNEDYFFKEMDLEWHCARDKEAQSRYKIVKFAEKFTSDEDFKNVANSFFMFRWFNKEKREKYNEYKELKHFFEKLISEEERKNYFSNDAFNIINLKTYVNTLIEKENSLRDSSKLRDKASYNRNKIAGNIEKRKQMIDLLNKYENNILSVYMQNLENNPETLLKVFEEIGADSEDINSLEESIDKIKELEQKRQEEWANPNGYTKDQLNSKNNNKRDDDNDNDEGGHLAATTAALAATTVAISI